ncbi:MAG: CRISPR-associated primase-polymerase type A1 [Vicinamibacteria bacterium]|nr:CRISPR-associated primase-polymerase type A1 [Vicinamibacteria bacterium]
MEIARLCEEAGQPALALSEYQLALRDDPESVQTLARLTLLYEEHGDVAKAIDCAARWRAASPADADALTSLVGLLIDGQFYTRAIEVIAAAAAQSLQAPIVAALQARLNAALRETPENEDVIVPGDLKDADIVRFAHIFAGRENVYARQWANKSGEGGYTPVREPFTFNVARNHLLGSVTVGIYPVRLDNTVNFFAFDIDISKQGMSRARGDLREARRLKEAAASEAERYHSALLNLGLSSLIEDSGYKGRHLWVFLDQPEDAAVVRQFGALFLSLYPLRGRDLHVEFFPKQSQTDGGIGNLIKLPLGIHRRTGRRSRLLNPDGTAAADPFGLLRSQARASKESLYRAISALKKTLPARSVATPEQEQHAGEDRPEAQVAPPQPPPAWTYADYEVHPEIRVLMQECAVLCALKTKVEEHRRLTHDERIVLIHSMGHSGAGVMAVNHLLDACVDTPADSLLKSPLSGNPISCPKIRKRIPAVTSKLNCRCDFSFARDQYPHPRLHLVRPGVTAKEVRKERPPWDAVERTRALFVLRSQRERLEREIGEIERQIMEHLQQSSQALVDLPEGRLVLRQEEGAPPCLAWEPRDTSPRQAPTK